MTKKIFNGIKQVSFPQFNAAKEANLLNGYLWFVRTEVSDGETNDVSNDSYDIYFGARQYGHFRAGELDAIRQQIEKLEGDVESILSLLEQLTTAVENNTSDLAALDERVTVNEKAIESLQKADSDMEAAYKAADDVVREEFAAKDAELKSGYEAGDDAVRSEFANADKELEEAYKAADVELANRLSVIEGNDSGKSMREVALDELSKQLLGDEKAEDNFKTLQDLAAWLEEHPEDVAEMNTKISANATAITSLETALEVAQSLLNEKIAELVKADEDINNNLTNLQETVESIPVVKGVNVNDVAASFKNNEYSVKITGKDVEIGTTITGKDNAPLYESNTKLSTILQGINDSIRAAVAGGVNSVTAGDEIIYVNNADTNNPKVSLLVEKANDNTVSAGHVELVKGNEGLYGVMYYDGDDVDPEEPRKNYKSEIEKGGAVTLENNYAVANAIVLSNVDSVVNLNDKIVQGGLFAEQNGSMIKGDSDSYVFWVKDGATLELNGNGIVQSQPATYSMAVWANGGTVTINGGTYVNAGEGSDLIYASNGGKVYIYDGIFRPCEMQPGVSGTSQKYSALNIKDKDRENSEIVVYGGVFHGFNPANNTSEGPGTNFVADGYESVEIEPGVWKVFSK